MVLQSNPYSRQPYGPQRPGIQSNTTVSKGRNDHTYTYRGRLKIIYFYVSWTLSVALTRLDAVKCALRDKVVWRLITKVWQFVEEKRIFQFDVNMKIGMEFCKDTLLLTRTDLKTSPPAILMSPCTSFLDENKWHRQGRRFNFVTVIIPLNMTVISLTVHTWFLLHWYRLLNLPCPEH